MLKTNTVLVVGRFNNRWMIRSEGGIIGDRKSFLVSVNYRLPGFKKLGS